MYLKQANCNSTTVKTKHQHQPYTIISKSLRQFNNWSTDKGETIIQNIITKSLLKFDSQSTNKNIQFQM